MQVVLLCGGMGTRIRDVADDIPKPMILIGDRPILWHVMKRYSQFGFKRFILCLGYKGWAIKRFFLDYHLAGADLTVDLRRPSSVRIHQSQESEDWEVTLLETGLETMTGGRLKAAARYVDGISDVDLHALVAFHRQHGRLGTVTAVHAPGRFGEMDLRGPLVNSFVEKPAVSPGWINGGFFVFQREFLARLPDDPRLILEREPLQSLAEDGELGAYTHTGFWQCMDNSRDYHLLNQLWQTNKAVWLTQEQSRGRAAA
jgi:glucose-1-phosphate cytidylyltransferase